MTWKFDKQLAVSKADRCVRVAERVLRKYFHKIEDFEFDASPSDRPFEHDYRVRAFGASYKIEHKCRQQDWGDELLEDVSSTASGRKGWTWRASEADYVLFTYPTKRCTIWPGAALEKAWWENRNVWVERYGIRRAPNPGYETLNVPVRTQVLKEALARYGAPLCPHCDVNVGSFRNTCECGQVSCCAIGDWVCEECAA